MPVDFRFGFACQKGFVSVSVDIDMLPIYQWGYTRMMIKNEKQRKKKQKTSKNGKFKSYNFKKIGEFIFKTNEEKFKK